MDELLAAVAQKTGLPADKAKGAVEAVLGFLKEKLPAPIASQIDGFLEGNAANVADMAGDAVEGLKDTLGGVFGGND